MWLISPRISHIREVTKERQGKRESKDIYPKAFLFFVSSVQELFEYLTVSSESVFLTMYSPK